MDYFHGDPVDDNAQLKIEVIVSKKMFENLEFDENGWAKVNDFSQYLKVTFLLTPNAWRGLGNAFSKYPDEPEWCLKYSNLNGRAFSCWAECLPGMDGPGLRLTKDSVEWSVLVVDGGSFS